MKTSVRGVVAAMVSAAVLAVLSACGLSGMVGGPGERVGELVDSWSEGDNDTWVDSRTPIDAVLLASEDEVKEWVETHGGGAEEGVFDTLLSVDLEENILVIGGYPRCQESSAVRVVSATEVQFVIIPGDEQISCAWSPYAVDAWVVPLAETGGEVPTLLATD